MKGIFDAFVVVQLLSLSFLPPVPLPLLVGTRVKISASLLRWEIYMDGCRRRRGGEGGEGSLLYPGLPALDVYSVGFTMPRKRLTTNVAVSRCWPVWNRVGLALMWFTQSPFPPLGRSLVRHGRGRAAYGGGGGAVAVDAEGGGGIDRVSVADFAQFSPRPPPEQRRRRHLLRLSFPFHIVL